MEEVAERIQELINRKGLTVSGFADQIGLSRPILSHILSGRNKPSLNVIQKTIAHFPDVSAQWLLLGKGEMTADPAVDLPDTPIDHPVQPEVSESKTEEKPGTSIMPGNRSEQLEHIVHYYKDGTFKVFVPR